MKNTTFVLVLVSVVLMLSYSIEVVSAYSTMTVTVPAGSKYTIWTDLNTGDRYQVSISVSGGANNDVDLIITDPQGNTLASGRVNQQYSTEIDANVAGRYNFEFDNTFSIVSDKVVTFSYQTVSQSQNPNTSNSNSPQTQQQVKNYYVYVDPLPDYAPSYTANLIYDATKAWMDANPDIKFWTASDSGHADLYIQWIKDYGNNPIGETISGHTIQIGLGDSVRCGTKWQPFSSSTLHHIAEHEIGHFLGLQHSSDPNSIMYPSYAVDFGTVEFEQNLAPAYFWFVPICSSKDLTSYYYSVSIDDPKYGIDVYFIPSKTEYDNALAGNSFQYYSGDGCHAENYLSYGNTCDGVGAGSGLLIMTDKQVTNVLTKVTVKMIEQPSSGTSQATSSIVHQYRYQSNEELAQQAKTQAEQKTSQAEQAAIQAQNQATQAKIEQSQAEQAAIQAQNEVSQAKVQQSQAEQAAAQAKIDAENKIKEMAQAFDKKTVYRIQIDNLKDNLKNAEAMLSGLKFESSEAQKKIEQAWEERGMAMSDIGNAEKNWKYGSQALNQTNSSLAVSYFENIDTNSKSADNHLKLISNLTDDAQKIETDYKKHRFCFLFWCFNI